MIQHTVKTVQLGVTLYRRHRGEYEKIGTALDREPTSYGARMTIRTPGGQTLQRAFGHATKLYMDEAEPTPRDTDIDRIAAWMEEQAQRIVQQAEAYCAGTDDEVFYEDLARHVTNMASAVRTGEWQVETV